MNILNMYKTLHQNAKKREILSEADNKMIEEDVSRQEAIRAKYETLVKEAAEKEEASKQKALKALSLQDKIDAYSFNWNEEEYFFYDTFQVVPKKNEHGKELRGEFEIQHTVVRSELFKVTKTQLEQDILQYKKDNGIIAFQNLFSEVCHGAYAGYYDVCHNLTTPCYSAKQMEVLDLFLKNGANPMWRGTCPKNGKKQDNIFCDCLKSTNSSTLGRTGINDKFNFLEKIAHMVTLPNMSLPNTNKYISGIFQKLAELNKCLHLGVYGIREKDGAYINMNAAKDIAKVILRNEIEKRAISELFKPVCFPEFRKYTLNDLNFDVVPSYNTSDKEDQIQKTKSFMVNMINEIAEEPGIKEGIKASEKLYAKQKNPNRRSIAKQALYLAKSKGTKEALEYIRSQRQYC